MSYKTEKTTRIFTGPVLVAEALVGRLKEINIVPIVRYDQQNGKMFGSGSDYADQVRVFIRKDELAAAQATIDEFLKETE
jgi:hypothetical protein